MMLRGGQHRRPNVRYYMAPSGLGHAQASLKTMADLARKGAHTYDVRSLATRITRNVPSKDRRGELAALYQWVRDNIRYRFDPLELEWIQAPHRTVIEGAGDCDDMATLLASLAQSLGHKTRFQTVGPTSQRQQHVFAQAHDGKQWVTLDPVLEKRQPTTAARPNELGDFARTAPGHTHTYDDGGNMLGFIPTAQQEELWLFEPWENTSMASIAAANPPDRRYRSDATTGGPPGAYVVKRPANLDTSKMDGLGRIPYYDEQLGGWGFLKKIGKAVGSVAKVAGGVASAIAPIASLVPGVGTAVGAALSIGGKLASGVGGALTTLTKDQSAKVKGALASGATPAQALSAAGVQPAKTKQAANTSGFPADVTPMLKTITTLAEKSISEIASLARGEQAARAQQRGFAQQTKALALKSAITKHQLATAKKRQPAPKKLVKKWDAKSKKFVYVAPTLSGFRPSFSLNLLGANPPNANAATATTARAAVARVRAFIAKTGRAPQIALREVAAMQKANNAAGASTLHVDGLWGPNSRAAAAYYTGEAPSALPTVAAPFQRYAVTWTAPAQPAQRATAPAPVQRRPASTAPKPAAMVARKPAKPATSSAPLAAARKAVAAVRLYIQQDAEHDSPAIPIKQVRAFQKTQHSWVWDENQSIHDEPSVSTVLTPDGLYGPKTRAALAKVLGVPVATLPPVSPAFAPRQQTAQTKPSAKPAATKPARKHKRPAQTHATQTKPNAKPAATKPARKHKRPAQTHATRTTPRETVRRDARNSENGVVELYDRQTEIFAPPAPKSDAPWLILGALYYFSRKRAA